MKCWIPIGVDVWGASERICDVSLMVDAVVLQDVMSHVNDCNVLSYSMLEHRDLHGDHGMAGSIEDDLHQEHRFMFLLNLCSIILSTVSRHQQIPIRNHYMRMYPKMIYV